MRKYIIFFSIILLAECSYVFCSAQKKENRPHFEPPQARNVCCPFCGRWLQKGRIEIHKKKTCGTPQKQPQRIFEIALKQARKMRAEHEKNLKAKLQELPAVPTQPPAEPPSLLQHYQATAQLLNCMGWPVQDNSLGLPDIEEQYLYPLIAPQQENASSCHNFAQQNIAPTCANQQYAETTMSQKSDSKADRQDVWCKVSRTSSDSLFKHKKVDHPANETLFFPNHTNESKDDNESPQPFDGV